MCALLRARADYAARRGPSPPQGAAEYGGGRFHKRRGLGERRSSILDLASVTDDAYFPGGFTGLIYDRLARFDIGEQDTLTAQLGALGYAPADVDTAILPHLHEDHIGGIAELKDADLLVSAAEWAQLSKPAPRLRGFLRNHIQVPGSKWHQISLEPACDPALAPFTESLDVMGDGSLVLLAP